MAVKVTVNLPDETVEVLKKIAAERGITPTQALYQMIESQRFLLDQVKQGNTILVRTPDNKMSQIIFR